MTDDRWPMIDRRPSVIGHRSSVIGHRSSAIVSTEGGPPPMSAQHHQRHRLRKIFAWGTIVLLASLAGGLWFAYVHVTDSDTLIRLIKATLPRYLPGSQIGLTHAQLRPFKGEIHLDKISVRQV